MKKKLEGLILVITLLFCMIVPVAAASGYRMEYKTISLQAGKNKTLNAYNNSKKINPARIQWKSSRPEVASVSKGRITAKKWGSTQIDAVYAGKKVSCTVYVYNKNVKTNFAGHKSTSIKTMVGNSMRLKQETQAKTVIYRISDSRIATISSDGILKAKAVGTVNVTCVSLGKNRYTASAKIVVCPAPKTVKVPGEIVMYKGDYKNLTVSVSPKNAYIGSVAYALSNNTVATISKDGKLYAKAPGFVKVSITVNGKIKRTTQVYVQSRETSATDSPLNGNSGDIIHRGLSLEAPENSIPAFELAGKKGAQYVETDVRRLKDGSFVIFHDSSLKRMCGVNKKIESLTYNEVKKYPIINGTNASLYKSNTVPTLQQYLECCNKYSVTPVIEIKSELNSADVTRFNKIIKMSKKSPVVISFKEEPLKLLRQINRTVSIQWIQRNQITNTALNECSRYKFDISAPYNGVSRSVIKNAHAKNIRVALWLFTDSKVADCYRSWGVDYLTCERIL